MRIVNSMHFSVKQVLINVCPTMLLHQTWKGGEIPICEQKNVADHRLFYEICEISFQVFLILHRFKIIQTVIHYAVLYIWPQGKTKFKYDTIYDFPVYEI